MQMQYDAAMPTRQYRALAATVGCLDRKRNGKTFDTIFDCLVSVDSLVLQQANAIIGGNGLYGQYGYMPVTDGKYVQQLPSQQLLQKKINGERILVGVSLFLRVVIR